jgi:hypothetical protein
MTKTHGQVIRERQWPPKELLHIIDVCLIHFNRLELLLEQLKTEEGKQDALYECQYAQYESPHVAILLSMRFAF